MYDNSISIIGIIEYRAKKEKVKYIMFVKKRGKDRFISLGEFSRFREDGRSNDECLRKIFSLL